jgi:hypothetical protein
VRRRKAPGHLRSAAAADGGGPSGVWQINNSGIAWHPSTSASPKDARHRVLLLLRSLVQKGWHWARENIRWAGARPTGGPRRQTWPLAWAPLPIRRRCAAHHPTGAPATARGRGWPSCRGAALSGSLRAAGGGRNEAAANRACTALVEECVTDPCAPASMVGRRGACLG